MGKRKEDAIELPAAKFMATHERELAESEEVISIQLLATMIPKGQTPLAWLVAPSPARDAWLQAKQAAPGYRLMKELRQYWLVRLLKAAKQENSPEAYRQLLEGWLIRLGVEAPEGVFLPPRRSPGAPRKESTEQIYRIWLESGRPEWSALAYHVYRSKGRSYVIAASKRSSAIKRCIATKRHQIKSSRRNSTIFVARPKLKSLTS